MLQNKPLAVLCTGSGCCHWTHVRTGGGHLHPPLRTCGSAWTWNLWSLNIETQWRPHFRLLRTRISPLALWFMYLMGKCIMNIRIGRKYGNVQTRFVFRQKMETCSFTFGMSLYPCWFYSTCSTVTNWIYFITMLSLQYLLVLPLLM